MRNNEENPVTAFTSGEEGVSGQSLMDQLRRRYRELGEATDVDIPIPGFKGELWGKYRLLGSEELDKIGKRVQRQYSGSAERLLFASADAILAACLGMYVPDPEDEDKLIPLDPEKTGTPIGYDERLIQFLELEVPNPPSARAILFQLFLDNDVALVGHYSSLSRWMADTTTNVNEEFLGE